MQKSNVDYVQSRPPFGRLSPREIVYLPVEQLRPTVRIAHRQNRLQVPERIIFDYELVWVLKGAGELLLDRKRYVYQSDDLLFLSPFIPHSFTAFSEKEPGEHIAIHFDFAPDVPPLKERPDHRTPYEVRLTHAYLIPPCLSLRAYPQIGAALREIVREQGRDDPLAAAAATARLTEAIVAILRLASSEATSEPAGKVVRAQARIQRACEYIEQQLTGSITVQDVAEAANLSASRLTTLFRQITGYTPMEYLRRARINEARRLLAQSDLSIKEIAARTGFDDSFHFSRVFRKLDGLSPTQYREALLAGDASVSAK